MNADILKRVVRAIADGSQNDLDRLADKIVEAERRTGHKRLADQLEAILKQPRKRVNGHKPTGDIDRKLTELPLSRRNAESLATLFPTESLEHHMVLPTATEERLRASSANMLRGNACGNTGSARGRLSSFMGLQDAASHWVLSALRGIRACH